MLSWNECDVGMPGIYYCEVLKNEKLAGDVDNRGAFAAHAIAVRCAELAHDVRPGQFLHIKCGAGSILRRPFSVCRVHGEAVEIVFEVKGEGTQWLSSADTGDYLDILGPLGNGFEIPDGRIAVVGGGLGAPPMLFAAASAKGSVTAILGFRDAGRVILFDDFQSVCDKVYLATDDGSAGTRGLVTGPLDELLIAGGTDAVLSCGQIGMQKAVAKLCAQYGVPCQVSLEERMGCGVGACLVCACATKDGGSLQMSRVCKDGPVFDAARLVW